MKKSIQIIHDYKIELLHKWINKPINYIVLPPDTRISLEGDSYSLWGKKVNIGIYDCFEAGHFEMINSPSDNVSETIIDKEMHQSLFVNIEKSRMSSDIGNYFFSDNVYIPPPSYGCSIGFKNLPLFTINRIEIYSEDFVLDENGKNIGKYDINFMYSEKAVQIYHDCVIILYDINNRVFVFEAEMGGFNIYSNKEYLNKVLNRAINGYTTYENPVTLTKRITIE